MTTTSFEKLLDNAEILLQEGQAEKALPIANKALKERQGDGGARPDKTCLPALNILAEIHLELGDQKEAIHYFETAVAADPNGTVPFDKTSGGGVEKFLYLAQLSEDGGGDSLKWLERGCTILRREIAKHNSPDVTVLDGDEFLQELQEKLARALCSMVEIYMTDLSFENSAEEQAEVFIAEALSLWEASESKDPTVLQTLASIRISQLRLEEAREALSASLELWHDHDLDGEEDAPIPDFATRVSLSRLLMEAGMEKEAINVLDRLVAEDDNSVEAWYLGGWCLYLLGQAKSTGNGKVEETDESDVSMRNHTTDEVSAEEDDATRMASLRASRKWLKQSLQLFDSLAYEDDRLKQHASELIGELNAILPEGDDEDDEEGFEGFGDDDQDEQDGQDTEMTGG